MSNTLEKPRCQIRFEQSIPNEITRENYLRTMKKFMRFVNVDSMDQLLEADHKNIQEKIEDYIFSLKNQINPNSFGTQLASVYLFYELNDVILNKTRFKKMYPTKIKVQGFKAYTREDIRKMLDHTNKNRGKALVLIFASTGCRVGGLMELKMGDLLDVPDSECKCLRFYNGSIEEYYGFLTPEASRALNDYLQERIDSGEKLTDDLPLITRYGKYNLKYNNDNPTKSQPMTRLAITHTLEYMLKGDRPRDVGGRFSIPTTHGFRKYFNRTMKIREGCNISICEKLMGHSVTVTLDNNYLPLEREELFKEFQKAIPELTISAEERQALRIKELEEERRKEKDSKIRNELLQEELQILKLKVERMVNSRDISANYAKLQNTK